MKKAITAFLIALIIMSLCGSALAVSVTYNNGKVTVSGSDAGFYEIIIDGVNTYHWVGTGMASNTFAWELEEGEHTVRLYSPDGDGSSYDTFYVGKKADMTAYYENGVLHVSTKTKADFKILVDNVDTNMTLSPAEPIISFPYELTAGEHKVKIQSENDGSATVRITVKSGATPKPGTSPEPTATPVPDPDHTVHTPVTVPGVEPTCTKDGLTEGIMCAEGGEILAPQQVIPALGHRYRVESSSKTNVTYCCVRCGKTLRAYPNEAVPNRYGKIVKNLDGAVLNYQAVPAKNDGSTIVLKLDQAADAAVLTLENSLIPQIIREGYTKVEIVKGDFDAVVELNKISSSWFSVKGAVENYAFTLVKNGECKVEAKIAGAIVAADTFDGVTVK